MELEREFAIAIIETVEELLDEKNIKVPSDDREGDESESSIYGSEFYELEEKITDLLKEYKKEITKPIQPIRFLKG